MQPRDVDARKYYRVAKQRLAEAELIFGIDLYAAVVYLTGYAVECILKALLVSNTPARDRRDVLKSMKNDFGHNIRLLRAGVIQRGMNVPKGVLKELAFVSSWSPELRYEPGPGDPEEAERFLAAAKTIVIWADSRMV